MKRSLSEKVFDTCILILMVLIAIIMVYPFLNTLAKSLSGDTAIITGKVLLWPLDLNLVGYNSVFTSSAFHYALRNTSIITVAGTALSLILVFTCAYPLSRKNFIARKPLFVVYLFTMFFSGGMIPTYLQVRNLGLYDTLWALFLPGAFSVFNMILAKNFFEQLNESIIESAVIDGCNDLQIFFRIALPMSKPIIATILVFTAVARWNTFMSGVLYTRTNSLLTVQMYVRQVIFLSQPSASAESIYEMRLGREAYKEAAMIAAMIPIMLIYPFMQKYFTKGISLGAVKG